MKLFFASELMNLIYQAVEILGGIAVVVLAVSFIAHKIKKSKEPKVYEVEVDKKNELKMIVKDEKKNKDIVKGALSKSKQGKSQSKATHSSSSSAKRKSQSGSKKISDKEIAHRGKSGKTKKSSYSKTSPSDKNIRIPKQKKKLPGRDTRIQILNKLSNTQPQIKQTKENPDGFQNKFYDIQDSDD